VARDTQWLEKVRPSLMVVDVSAEISLLTRLASVPQIVMRQHGNRTDAAHVSAYEAAETLLAPFPEIMEDELTPQWVRQKTVYLDGFCRQGEKAATEITPSHARSRLGIERDQQLVVVMIGRGGCDQLDEQLNDAARTAPAYRWMVIGCEQPNEHAGLSNLHYAGWVDQPELYLQAANVVVTAAGHNSVMEIGRLRKPFVAVAQSRPFDEQIRKAHVLQRENLAIGLSHWPAPEDWPAVLENAKALDVRRWDEVFTAKGAVQAARHIEHMAGQSHAISKIGSSTTATSPTRPAILEVA